MRCERKRNDDEGKVDSIETSRGSLSKKCLMEMRMSRFEIKTHQLDGLWRVGFLKAQNTGRRRTQNTTCTLAVERWASCPVIHISETQALEDNFHGTLFSAFISRNSSFVISVSLRRRHQSSQRSFFYCKLCGYERPGKTQRYPTFGCRIATDILWYSYPILMINRKQTTTSHPRSRCHYLWGSTKVYVQQLRHHDDLAFAEVG